MPLHRFLGALSVAAMLAACGGGDSDAFIAPHDVPFTVDYVAGTTAEASAHVSVAHTPDEWQALLARAPVCMLADGTACPVPVPDFPIDFTSEMGVVVFIGASPPYGCAGYSVRSVSASSSGLVVHLHATPFYTPGPGPVFCPTFLITHNPAILLKTANTAAPATFTFD